MTVAQAFEELRKKLELSKGKDDEAKNKQQEVFDKLKKRLGPSESFIAGSYGRRTALRPLKDIDLFLVLPPPRPGSPEAVLESIRQVVQDEFPGSQGHQAHLQNHSVNLVLSSSEIGFDVVPAFTDPVAGFYWIPERDSGWWIRTNPRRHKEICDTRDQQTGAMFKPLVKMLKLWRRQHGKAVPSFLLEVMAYEALTTQPGSYAEGLATLFERLSKRIQDPVPDPAGTGLNVDASLKDRERARKLLEEAAKKAGEAPQDHATWSYLLGPEYAGAKQ